LPCYWQGSVDTLEESSRFERRVQGFLINRRKSNIHTLPLPNLHRTEHRREEKNNRRKERSGKTRLQGLRVEPLVTLFNGAKSSLAFPLEAVNSNLEIRLCSTLDQSSSCKPNLERCQAGYRDLQPQGRQSASSLYLRVCLGLIVSILLFGRAFSKADLHATEIPHFAAGSRYQPHFCTHQQQDLPLCTCRKPC
jgi:hypothetical protein